MRRSAAMGTQTKLDRHRTAQPASIPAKRKRGLVDVKAKQDEPNASASDGRSVPASKPARRKVGFTMSPRQTAMAMRSPRTLAKKRNVAPTKAPAAIELRILAAKNQSRANGAARARRMG